jgi:hypothetical protein
MGYEPGRAVLLRRTDADTDRLIGALDAGGLQRIIDQTVHFSWHRDVITARWQRAGVLSSARGSRGSSPPSPSACLLRHAEVNDDAFFTPEQTALVPQALEHWRAFVCGDIDNPGVHELHFMPMGVTVKVGSELKLLDDAV